MNRLNINSMASFDKIGSGIEGLDRALDWIRIGDNVVWQVDSVSDYRTLAMRFASEALRQRRVLIYIRFAPHPPILEEQSGLIIHRLDPSLGFERFTGEVHRIIGEAGREAFYVFDCLSELQTAWAADLMMGNFFTVTCPYLFELDTVAWFCILRHRHSYDAVARIRETTQILLDLFPDEACLYVHPIKVWKRYSPTMFFPHRLCLSRPEEMLPVTDSVSVSRFFQVAGTLFSSGNAGPADTGDALNLDSWERFFISARASAVENPDEVAALVRLMAERLIGNEDRFMGLVLKNCAVGDLLEVKDRMIGSGKIGGKAAGMIVARKIVALSLPSTASRMEPHDSFYVGSDVFYTYLVHNRLWKTRIRQRAREGYYAEAPALREAILAGSFPDRLREQFVRMLEYFGQTPIIVRSSSLLEDGFGHAFAGKYESVFCVNTGSPEDRLASFEDALRTVYASTMDESALAYREQRGLQDSDEQMAILVQRVSGSLFRNFFMPAVAGVGYSFNNWRWHPELDQRAGMIRVVIGLGTRAVDRTGSDYPRLVSLDRPDLDPAGVASRAQYCQRAVDGLDLENRAFATKPLEEILPDVPSWLVDILCERDFETERTLAERGQARQIRIGTCAGVVAGKELLADIRSMLRALQDAYGNPVDIEFTVNWTTGGEYLLNLLQCRPLQSLCLPAASSGSASERDAIDAAALAAVPPEDVFFFLHRNTMGPQLNCRIDAVISIDPVAYYNLPYRDKPTVARLVGALNARYCGTGKTVMLLAPGRIGTSSPELGLGVSFAEIDNLGVICEVACSGAGYQPELSYGSHFFQDLVESGIFYAAIPENDPPSMFRPDFFVSGKDIMRELLPESPLEDGIMRVYEPDELLFRSDVVRGSCLCARFGSCAYK